MENNQLYLVYILKSVVNFDGTSEYDFYFSENPEVVWGVDWDVENPSSCDDLRPDMSTISKVVRVKSPFTLRTIGEISCYTMEHAIQGFIAIAWTDLDEMEEYPDDGRSVFHFGDSIENVSENCEKHGIDFSF